MLRTRRPTHTCWCPAGYWTWICVQATGEKCMRLEKTCNVALLVSSMKLQEKYLRSKWTLLQLTYLSGISGPFICEKEDDSIWFEKVPEECLWGQIEYSAIKGASDSLFMYNKWRVTTTRRERECVVTILLFLSSAYQQIKVVSSSSLASRHTVSLHLHRGYELYLVTSLSAIFSMSNALLIGSLNNKFTQAFENIIAISSGTWKQITVKWSTCHFVAWKHWDNSSQVALTHHDAMQGRSDMIVFSRDNHQVDESMLYIE